jgi:hypothetical protein
VAHDVIVGEIIAGLDKSTALGGKGGGKLQRPKQK